MMYNKNIIHLEKNMHKPSSGRDYLVALLLASSVTVFLGFYLFIRRGYLFTAPSSVDMLYVPNKAIAGAGVILIAFVFLLGPIVRYFDRFDKWLGYRKEIGIVGTFLLLAHGTITYFYLPLKSPRAELDLDSPDLLAGIIGIAILTFLFVISFKKAIDILGAKKWWFLQRWGIRVAIFLTVVHVVGLKWEGWWKWITVGGTQTPALTNPLMVPASLIAGLFLLWVIVVRLYEVFFIYDNLGFAGNEASQTPESKMRGRRFFIGSFWTLVILYIILFTRFVLW
ncbi:MAG: hypothetical protein COZ29_03035 [Candidatus Moranbacteria bacterium CG_4_10_14_3_um_filter_45_9]|nr:MAG: hypothetical protein COZ29_03035 [Candidatus Moranbacteria bacterium CG_4_10_14_3_um_filter_45_9]PJA85958.1 MAG: hypothetical protein CO143_00285 [Candidatus Moranbacteria bacterium CG_4_9_14_3_um_filter_45_14]